MNIASRWRHSSATGAAWLLWGMLGLMIWGAGEGLAQTPASQPAPEASDAPDAVEATDGSEDDLDDLDDISLFDLEVPTVVTASRRQERITAVPHAVSVITAEDIRRSGARNISDALRLVPGLDVAGISYNQTAISPRGFHGLLSNQTLVLVDGRQIFDSFFGGTLWGAWPFQLEDIARIEVIRGPGGVTWGANAMNGVINIITKDPKEQTGATIVTGGGARGTYLTHVGYAFADKKLRMRVSGEYESSEGFKRGGNWFWGLDDEYHIGRMSLHAVFDATPDDVLTFSADSSVLDGGYPATRVLAGLATDHAESQTNSLLGRWTHTLDDDDSYEVTFYVNDFEVNAGMRSTEWRYQQIALQFGHTFRPSSQHVFSWGIDSRVDLLDGRLSDPDLVLDGRVNSGIIGLYAQDDWTFAPKWTLSFGGRVDYDTYGGFEPSGRISLTYQLTDSTVLWGAVSRAFQMPPAALRKLDVSFMHGFVRGRADRDVEALTLIAYELGYRGNYLQNRLDVSANLFWHEYWGLVTLATRLGPPGVIRLSEDNRATASLYGVELDSQFALTPRLKLLGNYTYQQLDWESQSPILDADEMTAPRHKFMVGARYSPLDDLHFSSHLYYVDDVKAPTAQQAFSGQHIDSYFRLDLLAEYEFWDDRAAVSVGVKNLLDNHHREGSTLFFTDAEVPRMIYAQLRLRVE